MKIKFNKDDRGKFSYHFAHLFAYNLVALNIGRWKFKYLFHDWEKPWLSLIFPYYKAQRIHRSHSNHHLEYIGTKPIDYEAMLIDWECSRLSKSQCKQNSQQMIEELKNQYLRKKLLKLHKILFK